MKKQIVYILFSCITLVSCSLYELDNQDPPKSEVYGNLVYINPEKPDVPINKNDAFQKVQKRRVQEKR